jgi:hypothetical protein
VVRQTARRRVHSNVNARGSYGSVSVVMFMIHGYCFYPVVLRVQVRHTPEEICYDIAGFVSKNKDLLSNDCTRLLHSSTLPLLQVWSSSSS